jgi:hypothetical protein
VRTSISSHEDVPVRAVRLAIVERSASARRPEAERETLERGLVGQSRKRFWAVLAMVLRYDGLCIGELRILRRVRLPPLYVCTLGTISLCLCATIVGAQRV